MKKNRKRSLRLNVETVRRLDIANVQGGTWWSWSCPPETRAFTNCEYCGPTGSGSSVNVYCGPDQQNTSG